MRDRDTTSSALPAASAWWTPPAKAPDLFAPPDRGRTMADVVTFDRPIIESIANIAARKPGALAVRSLRRAIDYGTLMAGATALASHIAAITAPRAGVALLLQDETDIVIAELACFASGRVCLLLNPTHPGLRLATILEDARPAAIVISENMPMPPVREGLLDGIPILRGTAASAPQIYTPLPDIDVDDPAIVIYTSGSTGIPKGYVRTHRQVMDRLSRYMLPVQVGPDDRFLTLFSLCSGPGTWAAMSALLAGAELYVSGGATDGLRSVVQLIATRSISIVWAIPTLLRALLALPDIRASFRSVRAVSPISETVLRSDLEVWRTVLPPGCAIRQTYSMTETSGLAGWFLPHDPAGWDARLPVGYPYDSFDFAIVGPDGGPVAAGEVGELWVRSRMITPGEWLAGRCVPGRSIADADDPSRRILRTNDLARLRPDGLLEFAGRADEMVKVRGNRIEPAEIEDALRRLPAVADVAVGRLQTGPDTILVAHVVLAEEAHMRRDEVIAHLRAHLPAYMVPGRIEFLPRLPRLPNGKLDRIALAETPVRAGQS